MAHKHNKSTHTPLLPESFIRFLKNNSIRATGLVLWALFIVLYLCLISYSPSDPTLNTASNNPPQNWLGAVGAMTSDILLQTVGLASYALGLPLLTWGWRLLKLNSLPWFWYHLLALPFFTLALAAGFAAISPPNGWALGTGLGGLLGQSILAWSDQSLYQLTQFYIPLWVLSAVYIAIGLGLFSVTAGLERHEWRKFGFITLKTTFYIIRLPYVLSLKLLGRKTDDLSLSFEDEGLKTPKIKDKAKPEQKRTISAPKKATTGERAKKEQQASLDLGDYTGFVLPTLDLLNLPKPPKGDKVISRSSLEQNARLLEGVLEDFSIKGEITSVSPGPVVTLYELEPAPGTKSARVIGLADDIARSMSAISARVAVVPGRNAIGIELPNINRETVYLRELLSTEEYEKSKSQLPMVLGKDISGAPVIADLATMPHLLVAGTTGSGKSVGLNAMILSLLYKLSPAECRFIMVDPKMLELSIYEGIPHLLTPVVTEAKKAVVALKWAVREMEDRYRLMAQLKVRNLSAYNKKVREAKAKGKKLSREVQTGFDRETGQPIIETQEFDMEPLPLIVIIIDEMADLMLVAGKDVEGAVQRLAQMARAAGLHVIMATQRPSVDVITGTIKANFPTRIGFQVTSKIDSRTILSEQGAEQLLGMGDMLYKEGGGRITRAHGPFVSDDEVEAVVAVLKAQGEPEYLNEITEESDEDEGNPFFTGGQSDTGNELYDKAVDIVLRDRKASTSYIQRRLKIGYNRAATLMEEMEENQVISAPNHAGKREILVPEQE